MNRHFCKEMITSHSGNANPVFISIRMSTAKQMSKQMTCLGRTWRNWNPCTLRVGVQNSVAVVEHHWQFIKKVKNKITISSRTPTSGYISRITENRDPQRYLYRHVHNTVICNSQKMEAPKRPPVDEHINKMWYAIQWNSTEP